jgi:hypothetical protein
MHIRGYASALMLMLTPTMAAAADWQVRRMQRGDCSFQRSDSLPPQGALLATKPTPKAACETAVQLKTDDPADTAKCFDYTPNAFAFCKDVGVTLPH